MAEVGLPKVEIYSDGGANPNPGPGGFGVILKSGEHQKEISQGYKHTTNNRMELRGVIAGLQSLKKPSRVIITTDSQYTINGIQKGWAKKWRTNNWFRTGSQKAQNWDLWEILLQEVEKHSITFQWIKGHTGHRENEFCDEMATLAMQSENLIEDVGYIEKIPEKINSFQTPLLAQNSLLNSPPGDSILPCNSPCLPGKGKEAAKKIGEFELTGSQCKKCQNALVKKYPKHTKKTLEKQYYYEYYHHCPACKTNYMLEEAKRDIKTLKI